MPITKFVVPLFIFLLLISGCVPSGIKPIFMENPGCETIVEGNYHFKEIWTYGAPAIIVQENRAQLITGEKISVEDDGIIFTKGISVPPRKYKFKHLIAAIDKNGKLVYGHLPQRYQYYSYEITLKFEETNTPKPKQYTISIPANNKFAFCLKPGSYKITDISFSGASVDFSKNLPKMEFKVFPNCVNYIGDLYLDYPEEVTDKKCFIPFKRLKSMNIGIASGLYLSQEAGAAHVLQVKMFDNYQSKTKSTLPVKYSPLRF